MTLDYCFFCHDKKHFCVGKGHFCSFLVSNIICLSSCFLNLPFVVNTCRAFQNLYNFIFDIGKIMPRTNQILHFSRVPAGFYKRRVANDFNLPLHTLAVMLGSVRSDAPFCSYVIPLCSACFGVDQSRWFSESFSCTSLLRLYCSTFSLELQYPKYTKFTECFCS